MPPSTGPTGEEPVKDGYEAPALVVLGTVSEITLLNMSGANPDLQLNLTSVP